MSFLSLAEFSTAEEDMQQGNDIWGWTDVPSCREFALMGLRSGAVFMEISDPVAPRYVGFLFSHTACSFWRDIKTYRDHAFIVADVAGPHGMQVFDLTQLLAVEEESMPVQFAATAHYAGFEN